MSSTPPTVESNQREIEELRAAVARLEAEREAFITDVRREVIDPLHSLTDVMQGLRVLAKGAEAAIKVAKVLAVLAGWGALISAFFSDAFREWFMR